MLKDYLNKQNEYFEKCQEVADLNDLVTAAKERRAKAKRAFVSYCRKQLKECCSAYIIDIDTELRFNNHYIIRGTKTKVCLNNCDSSIKVYNYDREDYFSSPLEEIKTHLNVKGAPIWGTLTDYEKSVIDQIIDLISA